MKKRTVAIALVALLAVAAVPTIAFASAQGGATTTEPVVVRGIADPAPAAQKAVEAASTAAPACPGYVDADNDGVCDNYAAGTCAQGGHHRGYVDADNDGVCDNYASCACAGQGNGRGQGAGYVATTTRQAPARATAPATVTARGPARAAAITAAAASAVVAPGRA